MKGEIPQFGRKVSKFVRVVGGFGLAAAFVSGCAGGYSTAEQTAINTSKNEVILRGPTRDFGSPDIIDCYTNDVPTVAPYGNAEVDVKLTNTSCFQDFHGASDSMGRLVGSHVNPIPEIEFVINSVTSLPNPNLK